MVSPIHTYCFKIKSIYLGEGRFFRLPFILCKMEVTVIPVSWITVRMYSLHIVCIYLVVAVGSQSSGNKSRPLAVFIIQMKIQEQDFFKGTLLKLQGLWLSFVYDPCYNQFSIRQIKETINLIQ